MRSPVGLCRSSRRGSHSGPAPPTRASLVLLVREAFALCSRTRRGEGGGSRPLLLASPAARASPMCAAAGLPAPPPAAPRSAAWAPPPAEGGLAFGWAAPLVRTGADGREGSSGAGAAGSSSGAGAPGREAQGGAGGAAGRPHLASAVAAKQGLAAHAHAGVRVGVERAAVLRRRGGGQGRAARGAQGGRPWRAPTTARGARCPPRRRRRSGAPLASRAARALP